MKLNIEEGLVARLAATMTADGYKGERFPALLGRAGSPPVVLGCDTTINVSKIADVAAIVPPPTMVVGFARVVKLDGAADNAWDTKELFSALGPKVTSSGAIFMTISIDEALGEMSVSCQIVKDDGTTETIENVEHVDTAKADDIEDPSLFVRVRLDARALARSLSARCGSSLWYKDIGVPEDIASSSSSSAASILEGINMSVKGMQGHRVLCGPAFAKESGKNAITSLVGSKGSGSSKNTGSKIPAKNVFEGTFLVPSTTTATTDAGNNEGALTIDFVGISSSTSSPEVFADADIDVLIAVNAEDTLGDLLANAISSVAAQCREVDARNAARAALSIAVPGSRWSFRHYRPFGANFVVTVPHPREADDADSAEKEHRAGYHGRLALATDRPLLRAAHGSKIIEEDENGDGGDTGTERRKGWSRHLRNVHEGLPPSGVEDGTRYLVHGEYEYYHYMQDSFDDNGWGCAYRSLQTICSWFRLQQFTDRPVPGHREIQETLVKVRDKEKSFIGSKKWIGAFECSLCLDALLGVTCKILNVNSGAELAEKGREIAKHFEENGTPIMVGGGVLAYTLLGIDFNMQTGDIRFLILDPHYTGNDDMKVIHKSWCKWHGIDLFRSDAFYNLCCPQRPTDI